MTMIRPRSDVVYGICRGLPSVHNLCCLRHYKTLKCIKPIDFAFNVWIFQRHLKRRHTFYP